MKKYITAAAFLVAGTALSSAASVVLDSILSPVDGNTQGLDAVSAWSAIVGHSFDSEQTNPSTGVYKYGNGGYSSVMYGNNSTNVKGITLSSMFVSSGTFDADVSYKLDSFSFVTRSDNAAQQTSYVVQIQDASGNVVATSGAFDYTNAGASGTYGYATATFDSEVILDSTAEYKFYFGSLSGDTFTQSNIGQGVINPYYFSANPENSWFLDGYNGYSSVIQLGLTAVPEPSAFGLLAGAGALALVASRRRRAK